MVTLLGVLLLLVMLLGVLPLVLVLVLPWWRGVRVKQPSDERLLAVLL